MKFFSHHCLIALTIAMCLPYLQLLTHAADSCVMPVTDLEAVFGHSPGTKPSELQRTPADSYTQCVTQCCNNTEGQCNVLEFRPVSDTHVTQEPNCILYHCDAIEGCLISPKDGAQIYADSKVVEKAIIKPTPSTTRPVATGSTTSSRPATTAAAPAQPETGSTTLNPTTTQQQQKGNSTTTAAGSSTTTAVQDDTKTQAATTSKADQHTEASTPAGKDGDTGPSTKSSSSSTSSASTHAKATTSTTASSTELKTSQSTHSSSTTTSSKSFPDGAKTTPVSTSAPTANVIGEAGSQSTIPSGAIVTTASSNSTTQEGVTATFTGELAGVTSNVTVHAGNGTNSSAVGVELQGGPDTDNATSGLSNADNVFSDKSVTTLGLLISALALGCIFFLVATAFVGKRVYDSWKKRHYCRVERDYLIDGMYAE